MTPSSAPRRPAGSASTSRSRRPPRCGRPHRGFPPAPRPGSWAPGSPRPRSSACSSRPSAPGTTAPTSLPVRPARCRPCGSGRSGTSRTTAQQLAPQAIDNSTVEISPIYYRQLLDAAWTAFQQTGHGKDKILIGEVAPRGETTGGLPGNFSGMVPLRFIRALYCVDQSLHPLRGTAATLRGCPPTAAGSKAFPTDNPGLFHATGFAFHPYPQGQVTPDTATPHEPDYADLPKVRASRRRSTAPRRHTGRAPDSRSTTPSSAIRPTRRRRSRARSVPRWRRIT